MPDHLESMRQEVMQTEKASYFKLHNLAGDRLAALCCPNAHDTSPGLAKKGSHPCSKCAAAGGRHLALCSASLGRLP